MKTLPKLLTATFLTALCAGATPASAQTAEAVSFTQASPASLRLRVANATPLTGWVQVVRLRTRQTLFTEAYEAPAYGHRFDFSDVPSGRYLVWLQSGGTTHRCVVRVRTRAQASTIHFAKVTSRTMPESVAARKRPGTQVIAPAISIVAGPMLQPEKQL